MSMQKLNTNLLTVAGLLMVSLSFHSCTNPGPEATLAVDNTGDIWFKAVADPSQPGQLALLVSSKPEYDQLAVCTGVDHPDECKPTNAKAKNYKVIKRLENTGKPRSYFVVPTLSLALGTKVAAKVWNAAKVAAGQSKDAPARMAELEAESGGVGATGSASFAKDVQSILRAKCTGCHTRFVALGSANPPPALNDYSDFVENQQAKLSTKNIYFMVSMTTETATRNGKQLNRMPKAPAKLTAAEIEVFKNWEAGGFKE